MKYVHSELFQAFKRAQERAELQQRALAQDIERERLRGKWGTKPTKPTKPTPTVTVKRRVVREEKA